MKYKPGKKQLLITVIVLLLCVSSSIVIAVSLSSHKPKPSKHQSSNTSQLSSESNTTTTSSASSIIPPNLPASQRNITAQPLYDAQLVKHLNSNPVANPATISPTTIKSAYNVTSAPSGSGTIAIVDAYNDPDIASDLATFSTNYGLPSCTMQNGCFEEHFMASGISQNSDWALESTLDTQWAHAIAPHARILFIETPSNYISDLMAGVQYAMSRPDVVAVSLSWGSSEFSGETSYDSIFYNTRNVAIFAAAGDSGHGVWWPAASPYVIGVGGTTLTLNGNESFQSETAWADSGGGLSVYESEPSFQSTYGIPNAGGQRGTPDVSYAADPNVDGFPIYLSVPYDGETGWFTIGGTSAGTPQWAALQADSRRITLSRLYSDAASSNYSLLFRDITSGSNGGCGTECSANTGYDYITGLGSPLTSRF